MVHFVQNKNKPILRNVVIGIEFKTSYCILFCTALDAKKLERFTISTLLTNILKPASPHYSYNDHMCKI